VKLINLSDGKLGSVDKRIEFVKIYENGGE